MMVVSLLSHSKPPLCSLSPPQGSLLGVCRRSYTLRVCPLKGVREEIDLWVVFKLLISLLKEGCWGEVEEKREVVLGELVEEIS